MQPKVMGCAGAHHGGLPAPRGGDAGRQLVSGSLLLTVQAGVLLPPAPRGPSSSSRGCSAARPLRGTEKAGGVSAGRGELPVGQRDHPVGGVGLLLALDLLRCCLFKGRREVAQVGVEFLGKHGEAKKWGGAGRPSSHRSERGGVSGGRSVPAAAWAPRAAESFMGRPRQPCSAAPTCGTSALLRAAAGLTAILFLIRESFSCASASSAFASSRACLLGATSQ